MHGSHLLKFLIVADIRAPQMNARTARTVIIETMLKNGQHSYLTIARMVGVTKQRVSQIKKRMTKDERLGALQVLKEKSMVEN
jgi:alkylated DNA nucleotide flippase Atl1